MRIDIHNHALPQQAIDRLRTDPVYRVRIDGDRWTGGHHVPFVVAPEFIDPAAKLVQLESRGLDGAVVSAIPPLFYSELDPEPLAQLSAAVNEGLAAFQTAHPDRFRWMAHVPLPHPELAAETLEQAVVDGAVGVEIPSRLRDRRLDDPGLELFWDAVERLGVPVLVHPFGNEPHPGLDPWYLQNVIGNQLETTIAVERLICAGTFDRHPALRMIFVHAGGFFPFQAGRLRHARTVRPELTEAPDDPWRYRGRVLVDTITHDREALAYVIGRMGAENVLLGTDLPFDMATPQPVADLEAVVDEATVSTVSGGNAARLFGLGAGGPA